MVRNSFSNTWDEVSVCLVWGASHLGYAVWHPSHSLFECNTSSATPKLSELVLTAAAMIFKQSLTSISTTVQHPRISEQDAGTSARYDPARAVAVLTAFNENMRVEISPTVKDVKMIRAHVGIYRLKSLRCEEYESNNHQFFPNLFYAPAPDLFSASSRTFGDHSTHLPILLS